MSDIGKSENNYTEFDPEWYYRVFYGEFNHSTEPNELFHFYLDSLSEVYNSGKICGDTLLDFGTGPVIHNLISAARHFPNIYLSDYSENNRESLWRWLSRDPTALDFSHFFKYVTKTENISISWQNQEVDMRRRVKGILHCDMTNDNPLFPSIFPQFDVINTSLCLCCVPTSTREKYETAVKNLSKLLKDGGWIVYIDVLNESFYSFGEQKYRVLPVDKDLVVNTFDNAGFKIDVWKQLDVSPEEMQTSAYCDFEGFFFLTAQKKSCT